MKHPLRVGVALAMTALCSSTMAPLAVAASAPSVAPDPYPLNYHGVDAASGLFAYGNCTWWAWNAWWQNFGIVLPGLLGNGGDWGTSLAQAGYKTITALTPSSIGNPVGDLAWWAPSGADPAGHVGMVIGYNAAQRSLTVAYSSWSGSTGWPGHAVMREGNLVIDEWTGTYPLSGAAAPTGLILPPAGGAQTGMLRTENDPGGGTDQAYLWGSDPLPRRLQLVPGERVSVDTQWQNIGSAAWSSAVRLGGAGAGAGLAVYGSAVPGSVAPTSVATLPLVVQAGGSSGTFSLSAGLSGPGGPFGANYSATAYVNTDGAASVTATAAGSGAVGGLASVAVTVQNTGGTTWVGKEPSAPFGIVDVGNGQAFVSFQQYGLLRVSGPGDASYGNFVPLTNGVVWPSSDAGMTDTATLNLSLPVPSVGTTSGTWQMADRYTNASGNTVTTPFGPPIQVSVQGSASGGSPAATPAPAGSPQVIQGADRAATSVAVAATLYPSGPPQKTVVLASGASANLVDALVAAPLATALQAPILVTGGNDGVDSNILQYLQQYRITQVDLVGILGSAAVSAVDIPQLEQADPGLKVVTGLTGVDRYQTAALIAARLASIAGPSHTVMVASGTDNHLGDALAVDPYAARQGAPVLLTDPGHPIAPSLFAGVTQSIVVGAAAGIEGTGSLPGAVVVNGGSSELTALALANRFLPTSPVAVVVSQDPGHLVDGIAAGPLAAHLGEPLLFIGQQQTAPVQTWLAGRTPTLVGWARADWTS